MKPRFSGSKQRPFRLALHSIHPTLHARSVSSSILRTQMSQTLQKDSASPRLCLSDLDLFHTLDSHSLDSQEPQSLCNVSVCEGDRQRQRARERDFADSKDGSRAPPCKQYNYHINAVVLLHLCQKTSGEEDLTLLQCPTNSGGPSRPRGLNNPSCAGEEEEEIRLRR